MSGYENRRKQLIRPDLRKLIRHITHFKDEDLEYKQCEAFAFSHILHHRYLSVNKLQVQRTVDGLINKFNVHGLNDKALKLEMLVDKFVQSKHFKDHSEPDVQWSILQLMACLSDNPTSLILREDFQPLPELSDYWTLKDDDQYVDTASARRQDDEPILDWGEFLKEGIEEFQLPKDDDDSIAWSDAESNGEKSIDTEYPLSQMPTLGEAARTLSSEKDIHSEFSFPHSNMRGFSDEHEGPGKLYEDNMLSENWLKENIQYNWWNDQTLRTAPSSTHPSARLAVLWEELEHKQTRGLIPVGGTLLMTEYKVICELLWMLHAPTTTFLFQVSEDGHVSTKANISIPSLTPAALASLLDSSVCKYSELVLSMQNFIDDIQAGESEVKKPSYTYQSYSAALQELLLNFFHRVSLIGDKVAKQVSTITLVMVLEELRPEFEKLDYLYSLHKISICDWRSAEGWFAAVRLLSHLFDAVYTSWKHEFAMIAMSLFVKSFRVYIQIIDIWFTHGKLQDDRGEFIIRRYEEEMRIVSYHAVLQELRKTEILEMFQALVSACCDLEYIRRLGEINVLRTKVGNKGYLYNEFIDKVKFELNHFIKEDDNNTEYTRTSRPQIQTCSSRLSTKDERETNEQNILISEPRTIVCKSSRFGESKPSQTMASTQRKSFLSISAEQVDSMWYEMATSKSLSSPWLRGSFQRSYPPKDICPVPTPEDQYSAVIEKQYVDVDMGTLPLHLIISKNVILLVSERGKIASMIMVEILTDRYKLHQHLSILGNIFVLESSSVIQRFFTVLFSPVLPNNTKTNAEYSLNILLEECFECFPAAENLGGHLSVHVSDDPNLITYNIIECVDISYNVEWPLTLVITKESLNIYNAIFKFLVHIEWALYSLHQLRFSELKETKENQVSVRMLYKLRMFLLHCISTLHYYFLSFTPSDLRAKFDEAMSSSSSVNDIITAHENYLRKVKAHCLLSKGNIVMKIIKKLLMMCGDLHQLWQKQSQSQASVEEITELEEEYTHAHVGLSIVLKQVIEQTADSSLKLLSADIDSCLPVPASHFTGQGDQHEQTCY